MQLRYILLIIAFSFIGSAFAYECKSTDLSFKIPNSKKSAFKKFSEVGKQSLVEGLLYQLTEKNNDKTIWLLDYLENTEQNADQRAFFKLLRTSSDIETSHTKQLNFKEVCEIMDKIKSIKE